MEIKPILQEAFSFLVMPLGESVQENYPTQFSKETPPSSLLEKQ